LKRRAPSSTLRKGARVLVVGGGPAGSFFAVRLLRSAKASGRALRVTILEKKQEIFFSPPESTHSLREGCNFCAGGISPMLFDALTREGMVPEGDILQKEVHSITLHSDWKNIELPVPEGRTLSTVFRGTRPRSRGGRFSNFDSFLLETAEREGAEILTGTVVGAFRAASGKLVFSCLVPGGPQPEEKTIEADFAAVACGVNSSREGGDGGGSRAPCPGFLRDLIPGFAPPPVRRTLICELQSRKDEGGPLEGTIHFVQYGSRELRIEMASLVPKSGYMTIALLGETIDESRAAENERIAREFLELPNIRRLIPGHVALRPVCACNPRLTVGAARKPMADRVAVIGDMAVSRLNKDGLYSAYLTGTALADCVLKRGIDLPSLEAGYGPILRFLKRDLLFGRMVFFTNRLFFSRPLLSRILYQAVLTERKGRPASDRKLGGILWKTASGDGTYGNILLSMIHPKSLWRLLVGGFLVTARNFATERLLGLSWEGFGRHPTGISREDFEERRKKFTGLLERSGAGERPDFESMYSIKVRGAPEKVIHHLGRFGEEDRLFLRPRFVRVRRVSGRPNREGCVIRYDLPWKKFSFEVELERVEEGRRFIYRVKGGFASGGVLAFDVTPTGPGIVLLSVYVGFDFPRPTSPSKRILWALFRLLFPGFVHDVIWNHSLCRLKSLVELGGPCGREGPLR